MARLIEISLPDNDYAVLETLACHLQSTAENVAERAVGCYIRKNRRLFELLKSGYGDVGDINLELAEEFIHADSEALMLYEETLSESE